MRNVYDNGTMVLGSVGRVKNYLIDNAEETWEIEDIINDLEDLEKDTIVAINYDLGMGYSIEWWENSHIVNAEGKGDNMNKEQLVEKMYNYYKNGINNVNSLIDLKKEIKNNLQKYYFPNQNIPI